MVRVSYILVICWWLTSCQSSQVLEPSAFSEQYCSSERLEWTSVQDSTYLTAQKNSSLDVGASLSRDSLLALNAAAELGNMVLINQKTKQTVTVTQSFFQEFTRNRKALCDIEEGIEKGIISSATGRQRAESLYLDIIEMFAGVEKKSLNAK